MRSLFFAGKAKLPKLYQYSVTPSFAQVYEVYGDHESMLTQPNNLAAGILKAINGMHQD